MEGFVVVVVWMVGCGGFLVVGGGKWLFLLLLRIERETERMRKKERKREKKK